MKGFMKKILALFLVLTLSLTALPVFADSPADIVYVVDSSNENTTYTLCDNTTSVLCTGYNYVLINYNFTTTSNTYFNLSIDAISNRVYWPKVQYNQVFSLNNPSKVAYGVAQTGLQSGQTITITLSASQGCPACPTPEPCPAPDEPFIVGLFRQGFWGVATAVVALIVPIVALFLVFRLIHDFFWGRG